MSDIRQTKQKAAILGYLRSVKTHPTAEIVYSAVKKEMPNISLGTVYRNLEEFSKNEIIGKLEVAGRKRFDGDISVHGHFICEKCGRIDDLFFKKKIKIDFPKNYSINGVDLTIKGRCKKCEK
ncbi:MAG: transcriptional repressor [Patescibacteria group bacterium]